MQVVGECRAAGENKDRQMRCAVMTSGGRLIPSRAVTGIINAVQVPLCSCTGQEGEKGRELMATLR